jgi:O-antigen/teichoic acid export membrane protein
MIIGYIFWIILSQITSAEVIGASSALISLTNIFAVVAVIGIDEGNQRFLGKSFSEGKIDDVKSYVKASLFLVSVGILASSIAILLISSWIHDVYGIDFSLVIVAIILVGSNAIQLLLYSVVTASLKTKVLPKIMIVSSTAKLLVAVILILMGAGVLGLTIGYTLSHIISSILLAIVILTTFALSNKNNNSNQIRTAVANFSHACRNIVTAGVARWIPHIITTIGSQLGTIVIFGFQGSDQAGMYFIAL